MPNGRERYSCPNHPICSGSFAGMANRIAVLANQLYAKDFSTTAGKANNDGMRLGGSSFQKVKQPLRGMGRFGDNLNDLCVAQRFLDFIVRRTMFALSGSRDLPANLSKYQSGKGLHDG